MNKELFLSPSLVTFENLGELLGLVDEYIDAHTKTIAKYQDRLGALLRSTGEGDSKQGMMSFEQQASQSNSDSEKETQSQQKNDKKKRPNSSEGSENGWLVLESEETSLRVASGGANSANRKLIEAQFKIIESLKAKLSSLERVRKLVSELPAQGFKSDQKIVVMFRDGLPRQIIPSYEDVRPQRKFRYSEQFAIQVMA